MAMAALPLAAAIVPLIPGIVRNAIDLVEVLRHHPSTPEEMKAQLDGISADLHAINARVQAVPLVPVPGA